MKEQDDPIVEDKAKKGMKFHSISALKAYLKKQGDPEGKKITLKEFTDGLSESVAMLISQGHIYAWDYGYSFFLTACKAAVSLQKKQILSMACSIGLAFGGEKALKEFNDGK